MTDSPCLFPQIITSRPVVHNAFPIRDPHPYRIAIIGEAPGEDEENVRVPFYGKSGQYLNGKLADAGIDRARIFVGNVCQVRPPGNRISLFPWNGPEITDGIAALREDLQQFGPNICVLLGNTPLHLAKANTQLGFGTDSGELEDGEEEKRSKYPFKITKWRGSLFLGPIPNTPFTNRKCIPSLHPAGVLRNFSGNPLLGCDLVRARQEGETPELTLPKRELLTGLDAATLCHLMDTWPAGLRCSVDMEGGLPANKVNDAVKADSKKRRHIGWRCVSLSASPAKAFAIAWWKFDLDDHARLLQSFARLMWRMDVPKVLQNALYDAFVQTFGYGIPIRNIAEDTMVKGWEIYSELPKGLGVMASVYTREPHWKDEDMYETTGEALAVGCCKDTSVTLEICQVHDSCLDPSAPQGSGPLTDEQRRKARVHYYANMRMLQPLLYMELRGIKYDLESVARRAKEVRTDGWTDEKGIFNPPINQIGNRLCQIAGTEVRGPSGCIADKRLAKLMYEKLGYEPQFKVENGRKTNKFTTDIDALLKLRRKLPGDEFLNGVIRHRHLEGLLETLNIKADADGRVRCAYNIVGTETGRLACKTSPTGAGANLTTITKKLRYNYAADPNCDFGQHDLSGADGWTVAAHCARLGDPTMLNDYLAGLKPAKIIALLYAFGFDVNSLDTESLLWWSSKESFKAVSQTVGTGIYDCCKVVQHGSNYEMGVPTMQMNVMKKSFKESGVPIYMEHRDAVALQGYYFSRYLGLKTWHQWAESHLVAHGTLTSASGHTRVFFGRRYGAYIHDTVKEFLADEPQQNTTYATNLAMERLWTDSENRHQGLVLTDAYETYIATLEGKPGALFIEPLHSVHDALCTQSPTANRIWVGHKVKQWFNNELEIAGQKITIPFEGAFGPSWGELPHSI